ncbi:hypothetical protein [Pelagerythrobacter sp.]|uniref:hypothetical protein n=1 Tax=Pelagerythrobacter sp. TaxID=2800702 RepID=UPI0035B1CDCD
MDAEDCGKIPVEEEIDALCAICAWCDFDPVDQVDEYLARHGDVGRIAGGECSEGFAATLVRCGQCWMRKQSIEIGQIIPRRFDGRTLGREGVGTRL